MQKVITLPVRCGVVISIIFLAILSAGCISHSNTPPSGFSLNVGESTTVPYSVDKPLPFYTTLAFNHEKDWTYTDTSGYTILSTTTPGSYNITITTNAPEDRVIVAWKNMQDHQNCDKFSCSTEQVMHWSSEYTTHCESNRYSDCSMNMVLDNATRPVLEIWIVGKGTGQMTIGRVS
jgi:mannose-6-phosphate isomerase-like protein (cupin superfamily)